MEDNDGSLYPDRIIEISKEQRAAATIIDSNTKADSNKPHKSWRDGIRSLVVDPKEMEDMVGSVYIFSSKTMLHKDTVKGGTR